MYSTPIAITIKPMIRDKAFNPDAPRYFTIKFELLRIKKVQTEMEKMAAVNMSISIKLLYA